MASNTISIHAPIVGCDWLTYYSIFLIMQFQSTHPSWGATFRLLQLLAINSQFQSTHPSWGATKRTIAQTPKRKISIHAPIVGCDVDPLQYAMSIQAISIHAPIVGCDSIVLGSGVPKVDFNPRTHRGVRLKVWS